MKTPQRYGFKLVDGNIELVPIEKSPAKNSESAGVVLYKDHVLALKEEQDKRLTDLHRHKATMDKALREAKKHQHNMAVDCKGCQYEARKYLSSIGWHDGKNCPAMSLPQWHPNGQFCEKSWEQYVQTHRGWLSPEQVRQKIFEFKEVLFAKNGHQMKFNDYLPIKEALDEVFGEVKP